MAYCFECGEQVAENDTFCPYCGISLQSFAPIGADDRIDDSFSETIVAKPLEAVAQLPVSADEKSSETFAPVVLVDSTSIVENMSVDESQSKTDDYSNDITAENLIPKNELVENSSAADAIQSASVENQPYEKNAADENDGNNLSENYQNAGLPNGEITRDTSEIPAPKILERYNSAIETPEERDLTDTLTDENVSESRLPNSNLPDARIDEAANVEVDFAINVNEEPIIADDETEDSTDLQTESSLMSYEEAEVKEVLSAEEPEISVDENSANAASLEDSSDAEFETPDISPSNLEVNSLTAETDLSAENLKIHKNLPESFDDTGQTPDVTLVETASAEKSIEMPAIELPESDNCPPPRFDSVSIMEKAFEEKPSQFNAPDLMNSNESASENIEKLPPAVSFTAPIAANNDTGGKVKAKLKPLDEGTILNGRYEVIRKIGGGGMGAVYLASDKNLGGVLRAVKEMVQSYIEDEQQEKAVSDFKRESLLLTSLDHQSIPTIYDYFFDEKEARFYLVMKYISGGDLAGRLRSAPESRIDELSVTNWAIQIADVLDYLHNRQPPIVYRDLKPANIMVDGNSGRVMLIDFGIARWVNKEEKGVTAVGTMGYAPPELFSGNVEARSDIYSLGSTLFHLLTGADPQSNPLLIFDFQKHPRPRQINPQLSDQMERILMRAVEYSADKRFASAAELKKALEEHHDNLKSGKASYGVKEAPLSAALADQPVFCGFCGQKIVATDMFCAFCGSKQPLAQPGVHSESYSPVPLTARLLIIGTNELEQPAFTLEKDNNLVGRRDPMSNIFPEVDLSKFDPQTKISRRHARIWREGSEFMLEDLGSSNGTYILPVSRDSLRLQQHQPQILTNGDKIRLGDTTLHFILG